MFGKHGMSDYTTCNYAQDAQHNVYIVYIFIDIVLEYCIMRTIC